LIARSTRRPRSSPVQFPEASSNLQSQSRGWPGRLNIRMALSIERFPSRRT